MSEDKIDDYRTALRAAVLAATMLAEHDWKGLIEAIDRADAVGPFLDPTLYRDKAAAMQSNREVFKAAMDFVAAVKL